MLAALKVLAVYIGLSVFLVVLWLGLGSGELPATATHWFWLLVLAVPLQLVGECIGHSLANNSAARFIEQKTAGKRLSAIRMLYVFLIILFFTGIIAGASSVWNVLKS